MVCAHCGKLNTEVVETCSRCGRPIAGVQDACAQHPDRPCVARCSRCDAALCEECEVHISGSPYCPEHATALTDGLAEKVLRAAPVVDVSAKAAANFGQRLQAGLIDLVLNGTYVLILYMLMWALIGSPPTYEDAGGWRVLFWLLAILGPFGYLVYENAAGGRTVGKSVTDLIAVREDGTLMDFDTAVLRSVLAILSFLLGGIGFWAILWDPKCRALHDRWTHTIVIGE